jgi:hypothetical protein
MQLSQRIVLMASGALLVLSAGFLITQEIKSKRLEHRSTETAISAKQALWQNVSKVELNNIRTAIIGITRNRDALSALAESSFSDLEDELGSTVNRLRASGAASQLIVTTATGRPGRPSFAFATPLYKGRDFIGVALLVNNLKAASGQIKESAKADVLILGSDKKQLFTTDDTLVLDMAELGTLQDAPKHFTIATAGKTLRGVALPLRDAEKSNIGYLVTLSDITAFALADQKFERLV